MAKETGRKPPVETIPSTEASISALASAHAPILYFEEVPVFGHFQGLIRMTLTAARILPTEDEKVAIDYAVVAHLRMSIASAHALKEAIEKALLLAAPAAGPEKPN